MGPTTIATSALMTLGLSRWIDVPHTIVCLIVSVSIVVHRYEVMAGGSHPVMATLGAALRPREFHAPDVEIWVLSRRVYRDDLIRDLAGVPDGLTARTIFDSLITSWCQFFKYRHVLQRWTHQLAVISIPALSISAVYLGLVECGFIDFSGPRPWPVLIGWIELQATTELWGLHHMIWVVTLASFAGVGALLLWSKLHRGLLRGIVKTILVPTGISAAFGFANVLVAVAIFMINIVIWLAIIALAAAVLACLVNTAFRPRSGVA